MSSSPRLPRKPHRPELFTLIIELDDELDERRALKIIPFDTIGLIKRRRDFTLAAEKALQWNHDKGNL